MCYYKNYL